MEIACTMNVYRNYCIPNIYIFGDMSKKICTSFVCRLLIKNMRKMIVDKTNWRFKNVKVVESESK